MECRQVLAVLLFVISFYKVTSKDTWPGRTWQSNINFNNSHNWDVGRVPCNTDRVVLQNSESIVLELPEGTTLLRELVLPSYTEILLPKDGVLKFSGKKYSPTCDGQDAVFKPTRASLWTDIKNWDKWNKATPDLERIPCATDSVRFPTGASFRIIVPTHKKIGHLEINGVSMDSVDWFEFANSEEGFRQFYKPDGNAADLEITENICSSSQYCECENEYMHSEICAESCPVPLCKQPVKPAGFCCSICGAYFLLRGQLQNKKQLEDHINSFLKDRGVIWHASRVRNLIQVVMMEEDNYNAKVPAIAEDLKNVLVNSGLGLTAEEFHTSGHVWYPTTFGHVVSNFLLQMVLAVLAVASIIVFYSQNWSLLRLRSPLEGRPFLFARFENQSGEVLVSSEERCNPPVLPQAFDNPMYGATGQGQRNVTVENPIYTELEETSKMSPIKSDTALDSTTFSE